MTKEATERQIDNNKLPVDIIPSLFHKILTYTIVFAFCSITIVSIFWMIILIKKEGLLSIGGIPVITFFAGYGAYLCYS